MVRCSRHRSWLDNSLLVYRMAVPLNATALNKKSLANLARLYIKRNF